MTTRSDLYGRPKGRSRHHTDASLKEHAQYTIEDYEYLRGKGWTRAEIGERWDAEQKAGHAPACGKGARPPNIVALVADPGHLKNK